jgi:hypothetical protein
MGIRRAEMWIGKLRMSINIFFLLAHLIKNRNYIGR